MAADLVMESDPDIGRSRVSLMCRLVELISEENSHKKVTKFCNVTFLIASHCCNSASVQLIEIRLSYGQNKCHCLYCLVFSSAQLVPMISYIVQLMLMTNFSRSRNIYESFSVMLIEPKVSGIPHLRASFGRFCCSYLSPQGN